MKVLLENFAENIRDQIPETDALEHFHYRQEEQEKEEEALRNAVIKRQRGSKEFSSSIELHLFSLDAYGGEILQTVKIRAEIKKLALTLYLGESDLVCQKTIFESVR